MIAFVVQAEALRQIGRNSVSFFGLHRCPLQRIPVGEVQAGAPRARRIGGIAKHPVEDFVQAHLGRQGRAGLHELPDRAAHGIHHPGQVVHLDDARAHRLGSGKIERPDGLNARGQTLQRP